jgi:hypothetical protein
MSSDYHIARIVVGTVAREFDDDAKNQSEAWAFVSSAIANHDDEIAVVIQRDDDLRIGEIWANYSAAPFVDSLDKFIRYLNLNAFYEGED